jgi:outer membrane protein
MKTFEKTCLGLAALVVFGAVATARADDFKPLQKGSFVIDYRLSTVSSSAKNEIFTSAGVDSGLHVKVGSSTVPTLGFRYFLTDNVAVEAILGTSHHKINAANATASTYVHDTWVLPPVIALQYHFAPKAQFNPYVGAGVNLMDFYNGNDHNGFAVKLTSGGGTALQAGADIALKGPWTLNIDYKKVTFTTKAHINNNALFSKVHLDPQVVSVGVGYRF